MQQEAIINLRNIEKSEEVRTLVQNQIDKLERFFPRITGCEVSIDAPASRHHRKGFPYHVRVDVRVPGETIVVNPNPPPGFGSSDLSFAIHDTFTAASRRLQEYARKRRAKTKQHMAHTPMHFEIA